MRTYGIAIILLLSFAAIIATIGRRSIQLPVSNENTGQGVVVDTITLEDSRFIPTLTTVKLGEAVIFYNKEKKIATITSNLATITQTQVRPGERVKVEFNERGTISYFDTARPEVKGQIVVE